MERILWKSNWQTNKVSGIKNGLKSIGRGMDFFPLAFTSLLLVPIMCRAASSAASSHTGGFRVGGGVHDSCTFQCGLVGSFTSPEGTNGF